MNSCQDYGGNPLVVRDSNFYVKEYVDDFVQKWDELINWQSRLDLEGSFLIDYLKSQNASSVLDVATGTGFHSISLIKAGFEVTSADGSLAMLNQALSNGKKHNVELKPELTDWRSLTLHIKTRFDAIICMGNSFTFLFDEHDRRKALAEFYSILQPNGILIIDHRNYDAILAGKYQQLNSFSCYRGENLRVEPEYVDQGLARFVYEFPDGQLFHLNMFPLRKAYVRTLLEESGFGKSDVFEDFRFERTTGLPSFYIHIAKKQNIPYLKLYPQSNSSRGLK